MNEEELWVSHPQYVCLISKMNYEINELQIVQQGIPAIDQELEYIKVTENSKIKVDPLSKQGVNDLLVLNELNEFNCLHGIRVRYLKKQIYTQVGVPILIALNPYENMPKLYNNEMIRQYKIEMGKLKQINKELLQQKLREIEPHLYKVAQISLDELFEQTAKQNRICSMIISGESGSGKTESTKIILKYVAKESESGLFNTVSKVVSIEQQVFASNPLLEAFGNAKTAKNDNSSRFGKFIHIYFNPQTKKISSAKIDNYILEKSRVVKISNVERNYHIFYQLIGANIPELKLNQIEYYKYLKDGEGLNQEENQTFAETCDCLNKMNFSQQEQINIFKIVAAILHLGNIKIEGDQNESFLVDNEELNSTCELLGVNSDYLKRVICKVLANVMKQTILKDNNIDQALIARDTLAKHIYNKLFNWLIQRVNSQLSREIQNKQIQEKPFMIGILDIFGFEIFQDAQGFHQNSFEQLNINFTNEKLQQHFNSHMLETEQQEYNQENIKWQHIQFPDNKGIIDLIENPKISIYKLLIDQCVAPKGSDKEFLNSFKNLPPEYIILRDGIQSADLDPRIDRKIHRFAAFDWFCVKHFAGGVIYNVDGFVEKNKDTINQEVHQMLATSLNQVVRDIQKDHQMVNQSIAQSNIVTFFQGQLKDLLGILHKSVPKYIRCIKPNNTKSAFQFDAVEVRRQMRCAGLLEAIQIRKAGYEIRLPFDEFIRKYRFLVKGKPQKINQMINLLQENPQLKKRIASEYKSMKLQIGKSKIYMKEDFRDFMDQILIEYKMSFLQTIQRNARKYILRKQILRNLKKLLAKYRKLIKNVKTWLFRISIRKRIERKKKFKNSVQTMVRLISKIINQNVINKIKSHSDTRKLELEKLKQMEEELQSEVIEHDYTKQQQLLQTKPRNIGEQYQQQQQQQNQQQQQQQQEQQQQQQQQSQLSESQSLFRSTSKNSESLNINTLNQFTAAINQYEIRLKEEQKKRRELEDKVQQLEEQIDQQQVGRETMQTANYAQLEDILQYSRLTQEKSTLEFELEQLKSNQIFQDKKQSKIIQQQQETIEELQSQIENMSMEFLSSKQQLSRTEEQYEDQIQMLKREHTKELENLKKTAQQQSKQQTSVIEMEKEKMRRIEQEQECNKYKKLYETLKEQINDNDFEKIDNHSQCQKHQQKLEQEIFQRDELIKKLNYQLQENQNMTKSQSIGLDQNKFSNDERTKRIEDALRKKEQEFAQNKKLISVMNSLIKIKFLEVNAYNKHYNVNEQQKQLIYKDIHQIMEKEKHLMKQFEQLLNNFKTSSQLDESMQQGQ